MCLPCRYFGNKQNNRNNKNLISSWHLLLLHLVINQFALGWWAFVDGLTVLSTLVDRQVGPGFEDWAPGIITTLGMLV
jgi:hypothetical protein